MPLSSVRFVLVAWQLLTSRVRTVAVLRCVHCACGGPVLQPRDDVVAGCLLRHMGFKNP